MKSTRSIQLAAAALVLVAVVAQGADTPAQQGESSTLRQLAAVGDGVQTADEALTASPVTIAHSQQTVTNFLESGSTAATPASADQIMLLANKIFDVIVTFGAGYDSNPRLQTNEDGEWVYWADMRLMLNPDAFGPRERGVYYGFDIGSSVFSYSNSDRSLGGGRDQGELDARVFTGIRGAKSDVRFDGAYRMNNANLVDFSNTDRESRRADGDDVDLRLSGERRLDHSRINGGVMWNERNFSSDSGLNDQNSFVGDAGWLFSPAFAPKTDLGAGFRMGGYDTDRNFEQTFYEPSFRFIHQLGAKTSVTGRLGYTIIDYDGVGAVSEDGFFSYGAGLRWVPTAKTSFDLNAYRDFTPALVHANQNYFRDGVSVTLSQLLPYNWSFRGMLALESAEYFSTAVGTATDRQDDYWRVGGDLSHPLSVSTWIAGQFSAFLYYNSNDSPINSANFDEMFTGMKVGLSY